MQKEPIVNNEVVDDYEFEDTMKNKYLTFALGREGYGVDIKYVTEIIGIQEITEVPELPVYIKGIINLRGKIIPVMDVRLRFKKEPREYNDRTCIIVVDVNDISIGLIIDAVAEVITISQDEVVPPPQFENESHHKYIKGVGKVDGHVKLIIDCERLLSEDEARVINDIS